MEDSVPQPSDSTTTPQGQGASIFLTGLPSRGFLSSTVISSNPGGMRVYICDHDTSPPEGQNIKTNQQNILIRSLTLKTQGSKRKGDSIAKDKKTATVTDGPRKRPAADRVVDTRASARKANSQTSSRQEGSNSRVSEIDYQRLTVEKLRALLREKSLSPTGKKDELVARLRNANN